MGDSLSQVPEGLVGGYQGGLAVKILMVVFSSIALYNAIELIILIFLVFNQYAGLYFWAMLLSNVLGVIPHAVGFLLEFFAEGPLWFAVTLATIGFYFMVPGQSIVLYSRLHLVVQNLKVLRQVRYMIIFNTIVLLIPTTILTYTTIYVRTEPIIRGYNVMERMQLAWFCAQEMLISFIYIWETTNLLRLRPDKDPGRRKIMYELITINVIIVLLDVALLVLEYVGFYALQTTLKAAVYSVKLKLEFAVLRKLVLLVNTRPSDTSSTDHEEYPNFVDPEQLTGDITHAAPVRARTRSRYPWSAISMDSLDRSERRGYSSETTRPP
ncbi:integral membrane protein [Aspergillus arachidicola]|uniref:Integral membrane protein n=1 Tax=Aspergillus arachidicola TaxID=656916 RepID=A0A2G7FK30_9EURO|nr:integral membrane protein [Aspergillus arachidicola]